MKTGAVSTSVTLTLAAVLVLISQTTAPTSAVRPEPTETETMERKTAPARAVAPVRLPPPPAPTAAASAAPPVAVERVKPAPSSPVPDVVPLRPTANTPKAVMAAVTPLKATPVSPSDASPAAPAAPAPAPQSVTPMAQTEGRALLRMLEAGEGPVIEIAWQVNRNEVSGFVRQPAGALTAEERQKIRDLQTRHGRRDRTPVRVFPRPVDAAVLGGLRQIVGDAYAGFRTIRGRYDLTGNRITVVDVHADGARRAGSVALPPARRCG